MTLRPAREDDLPLLREIERAAGRSFAAIGMHLVADDEPPPLEELRRYADGGRAWVRTDDADRPVAYLLADVVDGCAHLEQVSVHPDAAGHGHGRELVAHLEVWAREQGLPAVTLTTYRDVPWNGPYYRRLGFGPVAPAELTPGLREIRREEAGRGLDHWPREVLRRDVAPPVPPA
ncbi:N-acetylglutamate synthase, GNAT family [Blastococcus aggregatus]|uniref:N-acetylglutamate synthase, GNAT family n=1 Tax=Blastococcus aggregatus TaxID=38502 RepID=A0A285V8P7_9ACTN|nr:GNAT family N-acetyltransferase [Blastococcus aggregatus]SOC50449.1 N-acetylglutamate synthase, GNAT family [Blastococcus aggregatus]